MLRLGLLLLLCTGSLAQIPGFGACPKVEVVQNFNVPKVNHLEISNNFITKLFIEIRDFESLIFSF